MGDCGFAGSNGTDEVDVLCDCSCDINKGGRRFGSGAMRGGQTPLSPQRRVANPAIPSTAPSGTNMFLRSHLRQETSASGLLGRLLRS